jgi:hypothetical protein
MRYGSAMPRRKLIEFHPETMTALEALAADRMATVQELADEAFADLLRKHGRPVGIRQALKASAAGKERAAVAKPRQGNAGAQAAAGKKRRTRG